MTRPDCRVRNTGWSRALLAGGLLLASASAGAEQLDDGSVSLDWQAPASCPSASTVLGKVRSLVSGPAASAERVRARGVVSAPAGDQNWQLTLETVQGARTWQRSLRAGSCEELADAGALIIALILDPSLKTEEKPDPGTNPRPDTAAPATAPAGPPAPPPAVTARPPAAAPVQPAPSDVPRPTRPTRPAPETPGSELDFHAAASAVGDWGSLPRIAFGAEVAAGVAVKPLALELSAMLLPEVEEVIAQQPKRGGNIALFAAGLRGCYELRGSALDTRLCAGFEAGRLQGTGFGTATTDTKNSLWTAARLGGFARYPLVAPLALRFGAEGLVPFSQPQFWLNNVGLVHQPNSVVVRLQLGLELLFR